MREGCICKLFGNRNYRGWISSEIQKRFVCVYLLKANLSARIKHMIIEKSKMVYLQVFNRLLREKFSLWSGFWVPAVSSQCTTLGHTHEVNQYH